MQKILLTVDLSYQIYRSCSVHRNLTKASTEEYTGGLFGFLQTFGAHVRESGATHVIACRDSKPYVRSRSYPAYKQLRTSTADPELKELFKVAEPQVLALLDLMGVPVWAVPGMEADDLTGWLVARQRSRWHRIVASANDSDLYQLCEAPNFSVLNDTMRNAMDRARLLKTTGLTPAEFMLALALQGTHNSVEGIKGVGEKKAAKAVKDPALLRTYRADYAELIDRNLGLILLPHPEMPRNVTPPVRTKRGSARDLYRWASKYDIEVTLPMVNAFDQIN